MNRFLDSLKTFGPMRLAGMAGVALAVLAIVGFVALRGGSQPMALLYGDLELHDSSAVTAELDKQHVIYQLADGGARIMVPSDQVDRLRLLLARDNLPGGGSVGYEVFDRGDSLTSNQFQQNMNQLRALEGELGRTIRTIRGVRNARVHLVLAKREPFAREQQEAQASIVLAMNGPQRMSDDEVQAIVSLVSTAVPGLKAQNISVVDNRGQLLARSGRAMGPDGPGSGNDGIRRAMEQRLGRQVEDMLSRTLGPGHVRAEATVEMDFQQVHETQESFDPDGQVPRTTQSVTDSSKSTEAQASVSVQNNLPNPDGGAAGATGNGSSHQEENTSFEIGKTVRTTVRDAPSIKRLSMAVLVDGVTVPGTDGKSAWREMSQPDLDRIATLVKSAIGYDEKRGDRVEIVSMRFNTPEELGDPATSSLAWLQFGKADIIWLITIGAIVLVALFALGFVVRPMALKLSLRPAESLPAPQSATAEAALLLGAAPGSAGALLPRGTEAEAAEQDTMLNVANIDGGVRASSIRNLSELVENHPTAAVTVIRGWLAGAGG